MTRTLQGTLACLAGGLLSISAAAELPPALDLVPADAPVVVAIDDFNAFLGDQGAVARFAAMLGPVPPDLQEIQQLGRLDGVNASGSLAAVVVPPEDFGDEEQLVIITPVSDYTAFARGLGGSGDGLEEVMFEDEAMFIKSIGNGYAAVGPMRGPVEGFEGESGMLAGHKDRLGAAGQQIADSSQLLVIANMERVGDQMKQQIQGSMMMAGAMAPPGAADGLGAMQAGLMRLIEDSRTGIVGLGLGEAGLTLHFGATFDPQSEMAGMFSGEGRSAQLMNRLPDQPYLIAGAMDMRNPQMKALMQRMNQMSAQQAGADAGGGALAKMMEKADGSAFLLGAFGMHQMAGGVFVNSVAFMETSEPQALMQDFQAAQREMNGQEADGIRVTTSYEPGARDIDGVSADAWGMQMQPVDPAAMNQQAQAMAMMFGPGGLGGYIAPTDGGVCLTYARNSRILGLALETARTADGLGAGDQFEEASKALPGNRTAEMYLNVDEGLKLAGAAMGGLPVNPQGKLLPIAFGAGGADGGAQVTLHIPSQTLQALAQTFQAVGGMMMPPPQQGGGPDF